MKNKAFTLIELLVVIAIIGVLASIVLVNLSGAQDKAKIAKTLQWAGTAHRSLGGSLVGHWNFNDPDNRYKDVSGRNNHGSCTSCPTVVEGVSGAGSNALSFSGNNFVRLPNVNPNEAITVSAWVKSINSSGYSAVWQFVSKYNAYILGTGNTNGRNVCFIIFDTTWRYGSCYNVPDPENWHHFVGTYDIVSQEKKLYVDGLLMSTSNASGLINADNGPINIAQRECCPGQTFHGQIDDVRIYSEALTAEQVSKIYAETKDKYLVER